MPDNTWEVAGEWEVAVAVAGECEGGRKGESEREIGIDVDRNGGRKGSIEEGPCGPWQAEEAKDGDACYDVISSGVI